MEFQESGLPAEKILEEAFSYAYAHVKSLEGEALQGFNRQINASHAQNLLMLDAGKKSGQLSEEGFDYQKNLLEQRLAATLKLGPRAVADGLDGNFKRQHLEPALEVHNHSDNASPELIAAVMLAKCVRSPLDHQRISGEFGGTVGGIIAEILHIDAYPADRTAGLAAAGSDAKSAYLALIVNNLDQLIVQSERLAKINPQQKVIFSAGYEEITFDKAKALHGNDRKLDQRFRDAFNRAAEITTSPFRIELDAKGALELTKQAAAPTLKPRPTGPGNPSGPSSGGGDRIW